MYKGYKNKTQTILHQLHKTLAPGHYRNERNSDRNSRLSAFRIRVCEHNPSYTVVWTVHVNFCRQLHFRRFKNHKPKAVNVFIY